MKNDQASMALKVVRFKVIRRIGQFADLLLAILCCRFEIDA